MPSYHATVTFSADTLKTMSKARLSAVIAARSALTMAATALALVVVRMVLSGLFDRRRHADWPLAFKLIGIFGTAWFFVLFLYTYFKFRGDEPAEAILMQEPSQSDMQKAPLFGFVAMEYYDLILNRTFVVFVVPEGLYGWKAAGPVSNGRPMYFEPYAEILKDPELMRNRETPRRLSDLKGGFFIPRSDIVSAEVIYKQKWGMSGIPHSGRIRIQTASGKSRELILLGSVDGESIQQQIVRG
jgi:hypothetical protein